MKKITALCAVLLFAAGSVLTAQQTTTIDQQLIDAIWNAFPIKFQAYGRAVWAPLVYRGRGNMQNILNDDQAGAGFGVGGGPGWEQYINAAVGFRVYGSTVANNAGFDLSLRAEPVLSGWDSGKFNIRTSDNTAFLWAQPFNMLKVQFGAYQWDDVRGKIGGVGDIIGGYGGAEDDIFQRLESDVFGALFLLKPPLAAPYAIQGLSAFASFGVSGGLNGLDLLEDVSFAAQSTQALKNIFANPHAGIAYKNNLFGLARIQYIGSNYVWSGKDDWNIRSKYYPWYGTTATVYNAWFPSRVQEAARVEMAVNITVIPFVNIDVGFGIPFSVTVRTVNGSSKPVGPTVQDLGLRTIGIWDTQPDKNRLAGFTGDVWHPPYNISLGADFRPEGLNLGVRFHTKLEFGEQIAFADHSPNFIGGLNFEAGLEPLYTFTNIGTASLAVSVRVKQNDSYGGKKTDNISADNNVAITSFNHNGEVDMGLGAFFTRPLSQGTYMKAGVCMNLPVGGDRFTWSDDNLAIANADYFKKSATEAFRKGSTVIIIPIILEINI
ncbi:MAG: hypothetical protein FWF29_05805 [Treponema sp.]|nr:hypothetical protein [Treponema sp.]